MTEQEDTSNSTELQAPSASELILGNYIKKERIGKGGFGEVYKAQHRHLKNDVVIKILRPDRKNEGLIGLLVREGQVLTKLNHENVVRVLDLSIDADDQIYLIMDYIDDGDLAALLNSTTGGLPLEEVARIINQVAKGLNYVHQLNIIHRDLKPQNILRDKTGKIVLADFGLAKFIDSIYSETSQSSGLGRAGTPYYMAPEHSEGKAEKRSDLYSLGVITYQLLTGHLPFNGTAIQIHKAHRLDEPPSLREFNSKITPEIELVVLKMLEKSPEKRYQNALDFARDLQNKIFQKTLRAMRTDPGRIHEDLENIAENRVLRLGPGDYQGPFILDKRLHLIGAGAETKLYVVDEAVLRIQVSGTQLENMLIKRTRESADEAVIQADEQISYVLKQVTIQGGRAEGATWEDAEWHLPVDGIDLGQIPVEGPQTRKVQIEVKEKCTLKVKSNLTGLKVFPIHLLPGPHTLVLEFNASGNLPGTQLDGLVTLQGESEKREIHIFGQLEQPVLSALLPVPAEENAQPTMEWAYQLWDEAGRRLLSELGDTEGKDLAAQWRADQNNQRLKRQMLDHASNLLFELVGRKECRWYIRRLRVNDHEMYRDEEIWELTLAIDGPNVPLEISKSKKTLCLECRVMRDGRGTLKISKIVILSQDKGVKNLASLPALVRLAPPGPYYQGISTKFIEQIQELPIKSADELDVDQLRGWQTLLEFQSAQIRKRQYWVGYIRHTYREGATKVTFFLDQANTRNDKQELIPYKDFQSLANKSRKELLKIFPTLPAPSKAQKWRDKDTIGIVEGFHPDDGRLEIRLEQKIAARLKDGVFSLPQEGYLHFDAGGDMLQKERHQDALSILQQGRAENPSLGDFFFDARKARTIKGIQKLQASDLLSGTCNNGQISAIEAALATRDLLLIQGPPGTGKTTVIAEICYQVALRGGRSLIASQSNLAVDNALSRIIHHPRVRALRKGNPETVEEEGRDYTEEYVIQKWLNNTSADCQTKLEKRQKNIARFQRLLGSVEHFYSYKKEEAQWESTRLALQQKQINAIQEINKLVTRIAQNEEEEEKYMPVQHVFSALLAGGTLRGIPINTNSILQDGFLYLFSDLTKKRRFIGQVNESLEVLKQIGLTPPTGAHLLVCSVWLKETIHLHNQIWAKSRKLMALVEKEVARLGELNQLQEGLERSIIRSKREIQEFSLQMNRTQTNLQYLAEKKGRFQQAFATINRYGAGSVSINLQEFHRSELTRPKVLARQIAQLSIGAIFPPEIATVIQQNAPESFWKIWASVEQSIQQSIRWTDSEREQHEQICKRLEKCEERFARELSLFEAMSYDLDHIPFEGYVKIPVDTATFYGYVGHVENNLTRIEEARTRPGIWAKFLKEQERQRILKNFLEARELLSAAREGQNSIPRYVRESNAALFTNKAAELFQNLQQWLEEKQTETSNHYTTVLSKGEHLKTEQEKLQLQCQETEAALMEARSTFEATGQHLLGLFQELSNCINIPDLLRQLAQQCANSSVDTLLACEEYRQEAQKWINDIQSLEMLVNEFWSELQAAEKKIQQQLAQILEAIQQQRARLHQLESERDSCEEQLQHDPLTLLTERQWWSSFCETIPEDLRPLTPPEGIFVSTLLEAVEKQFKAWESERDREEHMARRYDQLVGDWVDHLRNLTEDETRDLQEVYIQNANVLGITCGQAYKLSLREWHTFDTVIIDEVSKATAPELLLPAVKGQKLILIGDQHQLPPMIEDKTLDQMTEEIGQDSQAYRFLNRSYFKERYNEAPETIKRMLSIQYRMHPDIMAAINQFYERPLECGLNQPDIERDHQLESALVRKNKHLIWITTPLVSAHSQKQHSQTILIKNRTSGREVFRYQSAHSSFRDEANGTSQVNYREVEIIEKICEELQQIWTLKRADGAAPKEIGVITFYAAQANFLSERLLGKGKRDKRPRFDALNIRIGTVDRFQGMERAVIIVSMVRNNSQRQIGFARKDERINVAFSRAQELLIIVGCHELFCDRANNEEAVERYNNVSKIVKKRGDFIDVSCL